ncbi:hypothetical protein [Sansalvadorimonas verongulae]|uniref:hypothetical protein n=1 Tax=Sansalvadorimonas verongulae TaxID=2172824 RepID=UPI0012BCCC58|nr:hypothetical protein [Sansalvadorimonas verongulae]MTI15323.1 hypothetical protein [Sansalvadorimonas verongulae]
MPTEVMPQSLKNGRDSGYFQPLANIRNWMSKAWQGLNTQPCAPTCSTRHPEGTLHYSEKRKTLHQRVSSQHGITDEDKARHFIKNLKRSLDRTVINTEELVTRRDVDDLLEKLMRQMSLHQQKLVSRFPGRVARDKAIRHVFRHLKKTAATAFERRCFPEVLERMNVALKDNRNSLILSLANARPAPRPQTQEHREQNFFVERQQGLQCGRHAINAFYQKRVLRNQPEFEYMEALQMLRRMQEIEVLEGTHRPLVMHQYHLIVHERGHRHRMPTPKCFDDLSCNRLTLTMEGHHVCFARGTDGEWYLLDSLKSHRARRVKPSSYIRSHRRVHSKKTVLQRPGVVTVAVICQQTRDALDGCVSTP